MQYEGRSRCVEGQTTKDVSGIGFPKNGVIIFVKEAVQLGGGYHVLMLITSTTIYQVCGSSGFCRRIPARP